LISLLFLLISIVRLVWLNRNLQVLGCLVLVAGFTASFLFLHCQGRIHYWCFPLVVLIDLSGVILFAFAHFGLVVSPTCQLRKVWFIFLYIPGFFLRYFLRLLVGWSLTVIVSSFLEWIVFGESIYLGLLRW
jgi:hypothetical protein